MMPRGKASAWLRRAVIGRIRREPNLERMVAQGMRLGVKHHIDTSVYIDGLYPWLITIGDYVTLGPYSAVVTHDASLHSHTGTTRLGRVDVGDRVYVGVGAILLPGTVIGEDSVIAAGAVVHGEVPPGSLVSGNPGEVKPIKAVAAWYRASAARAPSWPRRSRPLTDAEKAEQRETLAGAAAGYVPARTIPGSPHDLRQRR